MAVIGIDLTALPEAVRKRMGEIWSRENEVALIEARIRQEKIAKFYHDNQPRWKDGFGPMVMAIDPYWRSYFAMLHKTNDVWEEKDFREWLMREEPMFKVRAVSGKTQVGYRGNGETGKRGTGNLEIRNSGNSERKFRKVY